MTRAKSELGPLGATLFVLGYVAFLAGFMAFFPWSLLVGGFAWSWWESYKRHSSK